MPAHLLRSRAKLQLVHRHQAAVIEPVAPPLTRYVAVGYGGDLDRLAIYSDDLLVWHEASAPAEIGAFYDVTATPDGFAATAGPLVLGSDDGTAFAVIHDSASGENHQRVTADGSVVMSAMTGSRLSRFVGGSWSTDDLTSYLMGSTPLRSVAAGADRWLTSGDWQLMLTSDDNGGSWTVRREDVSAGIACDLAYGNGVWVAVGNFNSWEGRVLRSTDGGVTWAQLYPFDEELWGVAYADGMFVAVGSDLTVLTSPDGETWTVRNQGGKWLRSVIHDGDRWIAVGEDLVGVSDDGVSWTFASVDASYNLWGIATFVEAASPSCPQPWAWYRGDDLTGYSLGDPVAGAPNRGSGGSALDLTPISDSPTYDPDVLDGHPGIRATGTTESTMTADEVGHTVDGDVTLVLVGSGPFDTNHVLEFGILSDYPLSTPGSSWVDLLVGDVGMGLGSWVLSGPPAYGDVFHGHPTLGGFATVVQVLADGTATMWVNGVEVATGTDVSLPAMVDVVIWGFGALGTAGASAEAMVINQAVNPSTDLVLLDGECQTVNDYLCARYPSLCEPPPRLWYRSDDASVDGSSWVTSWPSHQGYGPELVPFDAGDAILDADVLDGLPGVRGAIGNEVEAFSETWPDGITWFAVATGALGSVVHDGSWGAGFNVQASSQAAYLGRFAEVAGSEAYVVGSGALDLSAGFLVAGSFGPGVAGELYVNGSAHPNVTYRDTVEVADWGLDPHTFVLAQTLASGHLLELVVLPRVATPAEMDSWVGYFTARYPSVPWVGS